MIYMKNIMKEAHKLTREIKREYPEVDYKTQLGICISFLSKNEGDVEMTELKGTEKQIKWAESIRKNVLDVLENAINDYKKIVADMEKKNGKTPKRFVKNIANINNLIEEVKKNNDAKKFIEDYRLTILEANELSEIADIARNR